jgi:hypothetical protein
MNIREVSFGKRGLNRHYIAAAIGGLIALVAAPVEAKVSEARFGLFAHNVETNVSKNAGKEDGVDIQVEVLFDSPNLLRFAGAPRPSLLVLRWIGAFRLARNSQSTPILAISFTQVTRSTIPMRQRTASAAPNLTLRSWHLDHATCSGLALP